MQSLPLILQVELPILLKHELVEELKRKGCCATVIGRTTKGKERLLFHGEERRYSLPAQRQELWHLLFLYNLSLQYPYLTLSVLV